MTLNLEVAGKGLLDFSQGSGAKQSFDASGVDTTNAGYSVNKHTTQITVTGGLGVIMEGATATLTMAGASGNHLSRCTHAFTDPAALDADDLTAGKWVFELAPEAPVLDTSARPRLGGVRERRARSQQGPHGRIAQDHLAPGRDVGLDANRDA